MTDLPVLARQRLSALPFAVATVTVSVGAGFAVASGGRALTYIGAAAMAAVGLVVFALRPKLLVLAVVVATLFDEFLAALPHLGKLNLADDGLAAVAIVMLPTLRLLADQPLRRLPGDRWFAAYATLGVCSSFAVGAPMKVTLAGLFLATKGIAVGWAVAQVEWHRTDVRQLGRCTVAIGAVALFGAALNIVDAGWFSRHGLLLGDVGRLGMPTLTSFFLRTGSFSLVGGMLAIVAVAAHRPGETRKAWAAVVFALASVFTLRRTIVAALFVALAAIRMRLNRTATMLFLLVAVPMVVVLLWAPLHRVAAATSGTYLSNGTVAPRTLLYRGSVTVARNHFPLGAGFGRYGSSVALTHYSPEYRNLAFTYVWGLSPRVAGVAATAPNFGSDTFWPAVLGETGWPGLLMLLLGLAAVGRYLLAASREDEDDDGPVRLLGLVGIGWFALLAVESLSNPVYIGPPTYPLLFGLAGVIAALRHSGREDHFATQPVLPVPDSLT